MLKNGKGGVGMITPIMQINYFNFKKQPHKNENFPKKKSVASFKHILDQELVKIGNSKIDLYM